MSDERLTDEELAEKAEIPTDSYTYGASDMGHMARELIELRARVAELKAENAEMRVAINSAGEWIVGADIAIEPGWEGSQGHILAKLSDAANWEDDA